MKIRQLKEKYGDEIYSPGDIVTKMDILTASDRRKELEAILEKHHHDKRD